MEDYSKVIDDKLKLANELVNKLKVVKDVDGVSKLEKKIKQEIKFLQKIEKDKKVKTKDHLYCSNLLHLGALVQTLSESENPVSVLKVFGKISESSRKIVVDLVANEGNLWIKVIARNARALELHSRGDQVFYFSHFKTFSLTFDLGFRHSYCFFVILITSTSKCLRQDLLR